VSVTTSAIITSPIADKIMISDQPKIMVSDQPRRNRTMAVFQDADSVAMHSGTRGSCSEGMVSLVSFCAWSNTILENPYILGSSISDDVNYVKLLAATA
jgi:hypothetical protein